jgi:hypothetical protein
MRRRPRPFLDHSVLLVLTADTDFCEGLKELVNWIGKSSIAGRKSAMWDNLAPVWL